MKMMLQRAMVEATRLTRTSRLGDATALIQRLLRGADQEQEAAGTTGADTLPRLLAPGTVDVTPERIGKAYRPAKDAPSGGRFVSLSFTNGAGRRAYKLYIPASYRGQPLPLIVMLHGCTQNADDFATGTGMNTLAEERGIFIAYPVQSGTANVSKCWNWFNPGDQRRDAGEPSLIAGITRQIMADHAIDPRRVYIAGLSAGGAQAAIMAVTYPDIYAACGVHSGLACGAAHNLASALNVMQKGSPAATGSPKGTTVPTIIFHGDKDTTVHPTNGTQLVEQLTQAAQGKLKVITDEGKVPGGHGYSSSRHVDAAGRTLFEHWVIHGAGHAWSGGHAPGSFTDPKGPNASRELVRFFLAHALKQ